MAGQGKDAYTTLLLYTWVLCCTVHYSSTLEYCIWRVLGSNLAMCQWRQDISQYRFLSWYTEMRYMAAYCTLYTVYCTLYNVHSYHCAYLTTNCFLLPRRKRFCLRDEDAAGNLRRYRAWQWNAQCRHFSVHFPAVRLTRLAARIVPSHLYSFGLYTAQWQTAHSILHTTHCTLSTAHHTRCCVCSSGTMGGNRMSSDM